MLLQTNSYVVPREKRDEHARLLRRFRQALVRLGCDHFEVFEQVGANWNAAEKPGRFVQIMRFRDRKHQLEVQNAERNDPTTQALLQEFCELINFSYQQQQGLFAVGYYTSFLRMPSVASPLPAETPAAFDAPIAAESTEEPAAISQEFQAPEQIDDSKPAETSQPTQTAELSEPQDSALSSLAMAEPEPSVAEDSASEYVTSEHAPSEEIPSGETPSEQTSSGEMHPDEMLLEPLSDPTSSGGNHSEGDSSLHGIDFNTESESEHSTPVDDTAEPTGHDAFSTLPDADGDESAQISAAARDEAESDDSSGSDNHSSNS